ncbi:uncharacterized protein [Physcomitrium patens]|uniref:uncharacterized protein isoform X2 n=1 Tax=Physcomitrium patens TaxID=3218 RepID=UPI000D15A2F1|nr:rhodanese-like domain-containing protein 7 isoform X2 [Physcomitrium patens]|eukprot:XP_024399738.1 rhodanese-like domain-containing protein 7 isoform X2 [Physcomitrella patens]
MAAFHSSRLQPLSVSKSPVFWSRNSITLGPVVARQDAFRVLQKGLGASCVYVSRRVAASSDGCCSGNTMREEVEEVVEKEQVYRNELRAGERAPLVVVSFYKFAHLPDYEEKLAPLKELCETHFVSGGIMLAAEGINGSISGTREAVEIVMSAIQSDERLTNLLRTEAPAGVDDDKIHNGHSPKSPLGAGENSPARWDHVRVKLKKELVSMGVSGLDPADKAGEYVNPKDWNKLISDPDTVVVDVRNDYEYRVGRFKRALDPQLDSFRDFPAWVEKNLANGAQPYISRGPDRDENTRTRDEENALTSCEMLPNLESPRRIAMYCTGGIRCEKATSYLLNQGFDEGLSINMWVSFIVSVGVSIGRRYPQISRRDTCI